MEASFLTWRSTTHVSLTHINQRHHQFPTFIYLEIIDLTNMFLRSDKCSLIPPKYTTKQNHFLNKNNTFVGENSLLYS